MEPTAIMSTSSSEFIVPVSSICYADSSRDPTGTTNAPFIQEVIVGADGSTNFSTYDQVPVNAQSNLAGAYDPGTGRRHTFYQNPKGTICWVNHVDRSRKLPSSPFSRDQRSRTMANST
jgi:hypothetical protein